LLSAIAVLVFAVPRAGAQTGPTFGGFQGAISYSSIDAGSLGGNPPVAANQVSVAVGHFQHSSANSKILDLAVADAANETVEIWFGNGNGTFQRPAGSQFYTLPPLTSIYPTAPPAVVEATVISTTGNTQIAAADLTSDTGASGYDDIVLANFQGPGTITLLENKRDGSGTFTASLVPSEVNNQNYVTFRGGSVSIAIGDFNGDGVPDLAVGNSNSSYGGTIDVVLNNCNGGGAFNFCAPVSYNEGIQISGIAVAPLQKSNTENEDIVATDGANVYVLLNGLTSAGAFPCAAASTPTCQTIAVSTIYYNAVTGLIAANLNNGSAPDVVVEDQYGDPAVLLSNGSGTLSVQTGSALPVNYAAVAGRFDTSSADPGLILLASGGMEFLPNTTATSGGSVSFGTPVVIGPFTESFNIGAALATGDFNGDGKPDVVAVEGSELHVVLGNGDGTFQTAPSYLESAADPAETTSNASTTIAAVAVGNLHGTTNGAMDTVSADVGEADTYYPAPTSALIVRLAKANGTLQTGTVIFQAPQATVQFDSIVLGNYGGVGYAKNGALDIAAVTTTSDIYIFQNDGDGNFTQAGSSPIETGYATLTGAVAGDFAAHGSPTDIAAIGPVNNAENYEMPQSGSIIVFLGTGSDTFTPTGYQGNQNTSATSVTTFVNPAQLAVGSLGSSSYPDIVVADSGESYPTPAGGGVWVLRNQGNGAFSNPQQVSATSAQCCGSLTAGPSSIGLGHLFGTPYLDIVAATVPGAEPFLEVLQNSGNYTFPIPSTSTYTYPYGGEVAVADVNHDNTPDVLLFTGDAVQALLNTTGYPTAFASSGILLPWDPSYTTGPAPALTYTGSQPPLFAVGFSANNPTVPNVAAGDAQPAVDLLLNSANGSGTGPTLVSIAVTPANPFVIVGATEQFAATGTYSDSSTQDLTDSATWNSSTTAAATVNSLGLATGVTGGSTTISAAYDGITGSTQLTIYPALVVGPVSLPAGTAGTPYAQALTATGGSGSGYQFTVTTGTALSAVGLTLSPGGAITGTPTKAETAAPVTVQVTDSQNNTATQAYQLTIYPALAISPATLPNGIVNGAYSQTLSATGGSGTGYSWSVTTGEASLTDLGLAFSAAGKLTGPPTFAGSASFTVQVEDSAGNIAVASYHITVYPALTIRPATLPAGIVGASYSQSITATGGSGSGYQFTVESGTAFSAVGLVLSPSGAISGTPTTSETAVPVTVQVTDGQGDTASEAYQLTVNPPLTIVTNSLHSGIAGFPYAATLLATGGSGTGYSWSVTTGQASLAVLGLTLSASGEITGTPEIPGNATFTVQVIDSLGNAATMNYHITVYPALAIRPATLPAGIVGASYSQALTATGGSGSGYSWSVTAGTAFSAVGLVLSSSGAISGTPTTSETAASVTVQVTDSVGNTKTNMYQLTIDPALVIGPLTLPSGLTGTPYSATLTATGGSGTGYSWSVAPGTNTLSLFNLSLSSAGNITGTPRQAGNADFTAEVTDSQGHTQTMSYQINIVSSTPVNVTDMETITISDGSPQVLVLDVNDANDVISVVDTVSVTTTTLTTLHLTGPATTPPGQPVSFTATVTANSGTITPTGSINFTATGGLSQSVPLGSNGIATWTTTALPPGTDTVTAVYPGATGFAAAGPMTLAIQVLNAPTVTTLTASAPNEPQGHPVTFTAVVTSPASGTPTGMVTFYSGTINLGTAPLMGGSAAITTSTLPPGDDTITAVYSGDTDFLGSTSSSLVELTTTFKLSFESNGVIHLFPGQSITLIMVVSSVYGDYPYPINVNVAGLPQGATAVFSAASVTPGSSTVTATLTITLPLLSAHASPGLRMRDAAPALLALLLPLTALYRRRRQWRSFLIVAMASVALASATGLIGCGSGGFFNQPPQTYTLTVSGTSGTATQSTTLTLTVE
jgi:predicted secreted protein